jgi:hypothetical protein
MIVSSKGIIWKVEKKRSNDKALLEGGDTLNDFLDVGEALLF